MVQWPHAQSLKLIKGVAANTASLYLSIVHSLNIGLTIGYVNLGLMLE